MGGSTQYIVYKLSAMANWNGFGLVHVVKKNGLLRNILQLEQHGRYWGHLYGST